MWQYGYISYTTLTKVSWTKSTKPIFYDLFLQIKQRRQIRNWNGIKAALFSFKLYFPEHLHCLQLKMSQLLGLLVADRFWTCLVQKWQGLWSMIFSAWSEKYNLVCRIRHNESIMCYMSIKYANLTHQSSPICIHHNGIYISVYLILAH